MAKMPGESWAESVGAGETSVGGEAGSVPARGGMFGGSIVCAGEQAVAHKIININKIRFISRSFSVLMEKCAQVLPYEYPAVGIISGFVMEAYVEKDCRFLS
jgi:hypothetical protein